MQILDFIHILGIYWEIINYGNYNTYLALENNSIAKETNLIAYTEEGTDFNVETVEIGIFRDKDFSLLIENKQKCH